jgi:hypothetical protein
MLKPNLQKNAGLVLAGILAVAIPVIPGIIDARAAGASRVGPEI